MADMGEEEEPGPGIRLEGTGIGVEHGLRVAGSGTSNLTTSTPRRALSAFIAYCIES